MIKDDEYTYGYISGLEHARSLAYAAAKKRDGRDAFSLITRELEKANKREKIEHEYASVEEVSRIRTNRMAKGITQFVLAMSAGLIPNEISSLERKKRRITRSQALYLLGAVEVIDPCKDRETNRLEVLKHQPNGYPRL